MRRGVTLMLAVACPSAAAAQLRSGVYHWSDLVAVRGATGVVRTIAEGSTRDLAWLRVRAVTLPRPSGGAPADQARVADTLETLIIVKAGRLQVTLPDGPVTLGPRGVAMVMPGDVSRFANAGDEPVTYYELVYRSRAPDAARGAQAGGSFAVRWDDLPFQPSETGGRRQPVDRATTMFRRFEMHVTTLNAGLSSHQPHTHRAAEMVLMLQGKASMTIADRHEGATVGDLVFLASEVPHALDNVGDGPAEYFAFQWQ